MEVLIFFVISLVLNGSLPLWLSWWIIIPINFLLVFPFRINRSLGFWLGGCAPAFVWLGYSLWLSIQNNHILIPRLSEVLTLPHPVLYFVVVFFVPFLVGGLSSLTGVSVKKFFFTNVS